MMELMMMRVSEIFYCVTFTIETKCLDGLVDCEDPECCYSDVCSESQYCSTVPDPVAILGSSGSNHHFSSFFDRFKFLIEEGSIQKFAKINSFNTR